MAHPRTLILYLSMQHKIEHGSTISFGIHKESTSKVCALLKDLRLCATRLERAERDQLKSDCHTLGRLGVHAVLEDKAELCTHLLCNKFSVTAKSLGAIVHQKPIVTSHWVHDVRLRAEAAAAAAGDDVPHVLEYPLPTERYQQTTVTFAYKLMYVNNSAPQLYHARHGYA